MHDVQPAFRFFGGPLMVVVFACFATAKRQCFSFALTHSAVPLNVCDLFAAILLLIGLIFFSG